LGMAPDEVPFSSMGDWERSIFSCERSLDLCSKHGNCLLWSIGSHFQFANTGVINPSFWAIKLACDDSDKPIKKLSFVHEAFLSSFFLHINLTLYIILCVVNDVNSRGLK